MGQAAAAQICCGGTRPFRISQTAAQPNATAQWAAAWDSSSSALGSSREQDPAAMDASTSKPESLASAPPTTSTTCPESRPPLVEGESDASNAAHKLAAAEDVVKLAAAAPMDATTSSSSGCGASRPPGVQGISGRLSVTDWYNEDQDSNSDSDEDTAEGLKKTLSEWFLNGQRRPSNRCANTDVFPMDKHDHSDHDSEVTTLSPDFDDDSAKKVLDADNHRQKDVDDVAQNTRRRSLGDWYNQDDPRTKDRSLNCTTSSDGYLGEANHYQLNSPEGASAGHARVRLQTGPGTDAVLDKVVS